MLLTRRSSESSCAPGLNRTAPRIDQVFRSLPALEAEAGAEFAGEGLGHDYAGRCDERRGLLESRRADVAAVAGAKVRAVGQVEDLEEYFQPGAVAEPEEPADAGIELEEVLAAQRVV